ncbi:MAG: sulfotransferase [Proteobacteria bacterium]|nr:sulfotransferase [Pseudomonadota bacterium]
MMDEVFKKHCIFITSAGRTGTHFFGQNMMHLIEDCSSVHEPDVFAYRLPLKTFKRIREFGLLKMTVGKFLPRYSFKGLGIARISGRISDTEAVMCLRRMRFNTFENLRKGVYLEANFQLSEVADLIPLAFPNARIVYILRDPRSWVRSWMNMRGYIYSSRDIRSWFKNMRLTPYHFKDDPYQKRWKKMTRFEKLCWLWSREHAYALECAEKTEAVKVFRFEDLFEKNGDCEIMEQLLQFITEFSDGFKANWTLRPEILKQKTNESVRGSFPEWTEWTSEQVKLLDEHCGSLMRKLGYGNEPEWQVKAS